jgi:1-aminocyclopropane-1-carboxylate synthase
MLQAQALYYDAIPAAEETPLEGRNRRIDDEDPHLETATPRNKKHSIAAVLMTCAIIAAALLVLVDTTSSSSTSTSTSTSSTTDVTGSLEPSMDTSLLGAQELVVSPEKSSLSSRGQSIKMVRDDSAMFAAGAADAYHPTQNKDGYLVMLVAENKLMWEETAAKLEEVRLQTNDHPLPQWIFNYGDMGGQTDFKEVMAKVMQKWIRQPVDPNKLRFQAGAGSVLDCLSWCLAEENDGVLVTGPNYPAFVSDFNMRGRVKLHVAPTQVANGYAPTVQELDDCWERSLAAGNPPKILIICQPNNPTGIIYSAEAMHLMISWALDKGLHVVSDEIYALSVFPGQETTSAAQIMSQYINPESEDDYLGDKVHIVAGMSKDWGMSGFRVGSLFTHNEKLLHAVDTLGYYQSVSEYTQYALTRVFQDDAWVDWYIAENQRRLELTFNALQDSLNLIGVPLFPSKGALFAWADFSSLLRPGQSEKELWLELFEDAKVAFTTGESCNGEKPGLFRVVYPWPEGGVDAMKELGQRLVSWKAERYNIVI